MRRKSSGLRGKKKLEDKTVFGSPLKYHARSIPLFLDTCCKLLERGSSVDPDIFIHRSDPDKFDMVKKLAKKGNVQTVEIFSEGIACALADTVLYYFKQLPEPVIPDTYYHLFMSIIANKRAPYKGALTEFKESLTSIPSGHWVVVKAMCSLMNKIYKQNSAYSLFDYGEALGNSFLRPPQGSSPGKNISLVNSIFIKEYRYLFYQGRPDVDGSDEELNLSDDADHLEDGKLDEFLEDLVKRRANTTGTRDSLKVSKSETVQVVVEPPPDDIVTRHNSEPIKIVQKFPTANDIKRLSSDSSSKRKRRAKSTGRRTFSVAKSESTKGLEPTPKIRKQKSDKGQNISESKMRKQKSTKKANKSFKKLRRKSKMPSKKKQRKTSESHSGTISQHDETTKIFPQLKCFYEGIINDMDMSYLLRYKFLYDILNLSKSELQGCIKNEPSTLDPNLVAAILMSMDKINSNEVDPDTIELEEIGPLQIELFSSVDILQAKFEDTSSEYLIDRISDIVDFYLKLSCESYSLETFKKNLPYLESQSLKARRQKLAKSIRTCRNYLKMVSRHLKYSLNDGNLNAIVAFGTICQHIHKVLTSENIIEENQIPEDTLNLLSERNDEVSVSQHFSEDNQSIERYEITVTVLDSCLQKLDRYSKNCAEFISYKYADAIDADLSKVKELETYLAPLPSVLDDGLSQIKELKDTLLYLSPSLKNKLIDLESRVEDLDSHQAKYTSNLLDSMKNVLVLNTENGNHESIFDHTTPSIDDIEQAEVKDGIIHNIKFLANFLENQVPSKFSEARNSENFEMASHIVNSVESCLKFASELESNLNDFEDTKSLSAKSMDAPVVEVPPHQDFSTQDLPFSSTVNAINTIITKLNMGCEELEAVEDINRLLKLYFVGVCMQAMVKNLKSNSALKDHLKNLKQNIKRESSFRDDQKPAIKEQGIKFHKSAVKSLEKIIVSCIQNEEEDKEYQVPVSFLLKILQKMEM